jgi:thiamine-monophosphate kinase
MKISLHPIVKLSDLGERKAIKLISKVLTQAKVAVGIGDDCAALEIDDDYLLISTDMIAENTHIPKIMTPWQIGWFIVAINLSDIAAKGGKPLGLVLSLGLPKNKNVDFLEEIMKGADKCATTYKTSIIGGDTKENPALTICGTVFGLVKKNNFMSRKGSKPGDIVAVTGRLGGAGAGEFSIQNKIHDKKTVKILLEPTPKIIEGQLLSRCKAVNSCMDISDGLSSSLYQLADLNNVGFEIRKEKIPVSPVLLKLAEKHKNIDVDYYSLHFGGDYELLLTILPERFKETKEKILRNGGNLTEIGVVTKDKKIQINDNGKKKTLQNRGYEHFK